MSQTLPAPSGDNVAVVVTGGAVGLTPEQVQGVVTQACNEFARLRQSKLPYLSKIFHTPEHDVQGHDIVASLVEKDGRYILFVGLGLEVIQCVQQHEKSSG